MIWIRAIILAAGLGWRLVGGEEQLPIAGRAEEYVREGRRDGYYEDALRDLLLRDPQVFGHEDISGIPWIEIDFQEDIRRAETEVLAHIRTRAAA